MGRTTRAVLFRLIGSPFTVHSGVPHVDAGDGGQLALSHLEDRPDGEVRRCHGDVRAAAARAAAASPSHHQSTGNVVPAGRALAASPSMIFTTSHRVSSTAVFVTSELRSLAEPDDDGGSTDSTSSQPTRTRGAERAASGSVSARSTVVPIGNSMRLALVVDGACGSAVGGELEASRRHRRRRGRARRSRR